MRAIGVRRYGGPEALEELDLPAEPLGYGQVRVRVHTAAVNPTDTLVRSGARATGEVPTAEADVPGMDLAGVVTELGPEVAAGLRVGDRVMAVVVPAGTHGAYREDIVLPEGSVVAVPDGADDAAACTLPMNGLTAWVALEVMALPPGSVLAVTGAAGAFGAYVVELAKARRLTVVADAAEKDEELVRSLGADLVVPRGEAVAEAVRRHFPQGVDALADGSVQGAEVLAAVRDGGVVATVRGYRGDGRRGVRVHPVMVREAAEDRQALEQLRELAGRGRLTLRVADRLPAADAAQAHRRLEAGGVRGRLVLSFR